MPQLPKVSIIIPVYNAEQYLRQCLDSAIAQTLKDIEIICVDDGSTDSSAAILSAYAYADPRVHIIYQENRGYGYAVNTGMDAAQGEYLAILESDDFIRPGMYKCLYTLAQQYELDVVKADFQRFSSMSGQYREVYANIASDDLYDKPIECEPARVLKNAALYSWSGIFRLAFLRENHIRHNETPGASYQDNGFWFQSMALAKRVYFHKEAFYMLRRDNPNSSIHSKHKVYCIRDEYEYILSFLEGHPMLYNELIYVYWWARFSNYRFNYLRIDAQYKADFAKHFAETAQKAEQRKEIDWSLLSVSEAKDIRLLLSGWQRFHRRNFWRTARDPMKTSRTYRLLVYIEDNGLWFTIKKAFLKIFVTITRLIV